MIATGLQPFMNTRKEPAFRFLGVPTLVRASSETTNGTFGLIESWSMPPGFGSPYHMHRLEDEAFYVLEGEMAFVTDGKWVKAGAGDFVFGPRMVPHGFKVIGSAPARMLILCSPGGFERFVLAQAVDLSLPPAPPDMEKLAALAEKHSVDLLGLLPDDGGMFA